MQTTVRPAQRRRKPRRIRWGWVALLGLAGWCVPALVIGYSHVTKSVQTAQFGKARDIRVVTLPNYEGTGETDYQVSGRQRETVSTYVASCGSAFNSVYPAAVTLQSRVTSVARINQLNGSAASETQAIDDSFGMSPSASWSSQLAQDVPILNGECHELDHKRLWQAFWFSPLGGLFIAALAILALMTLGQGVGAYTGGWGGGGRTVYGNITPGINGPGADVKIHGPGGTTFGHINPGINGPSPDIRLYPPGGDG